MANDKGELCGSEATEVPIPTVGMGELIYSSFSKTDPDAIILTNGDTGRTVSCQEALNLCTGVATSLRDKGIQVGDVVALIGDNSVDLCIAAFASAMIGAVSCPIDPSAKSYEFQHIFHLVEPKLIICDHAILPTVVDAAEKNWCNAEIIVVGGDEEMDEAKRFESLVRDSDPASFEPYRVEDATSELLCLLCTSGTTGLPKAVMITHGGMGYQTSISGLGAAKAGPCLQTSFFYWVSGVLMMFVYALKGLSRVLLKTADPEKVLKAIEEYKIGVCVLSPTLLSAVVNHPDAKSYDLTSLRVINSGGSLLLKSTAEKTHEVIPGCKIIQVYGLSEISGACCKAIPPMDIFSVGKPVPMAKVKIVDPSSGAVLGSEEEGEVLIFSPGVMKGYYRNEDATKEALTDDGWLHTGDLGVYSQEGILRLTGRVKDLLKYENHQICPAEIEELIGKLVGVDEVVVVGIADGENSLPMALVVRHPDSDVTEEDIEAIVEENLSDFKKLRGGVFFVDFIPRTSNGKLRRRDIQPIAEQLYATISR